MQYSTRLNLSPLQRATDFKDGQFISWDIVTIFTLNPRYHVNADALSRLPVGYDNSIIINDAIQNKMYSVRNDGPIAIKSC
jgi:hypothetical protein